MCSLWSGWGREVLRPEDLLRSVDRLPHGSSFHQELRNGGEVPRPLREQVKALRGRESGPLRCERRLLPSMSVDLPSGRVHAPLLFSKYHLCVLPSWMQHGLQMRRGEEAGGIRRRVRVRGKRSISIRRQILEKMVKRRGRPWGSTPCA